MTVRAVDRSTFTPARRRALWHGLIIAGLVFNATLLVFWLPDLFIWIDAVAWRSLDVANPYASAQGAIDRIGAFLYPPPAVYLFAPLAWLPWAVFAPLFLGLNLAAVVLLTGRRAAIALLAFPPVLLELLNGNIHLLMAAAIWLGFRWPAAWSFVLLTKVTPGVGALWFAFRREWRSFAIAVAVTGVICLVTFIATPTLWMDWFGLMVGATPRPSLLPPLLVRVPAAIALIWFAARTDRAWLVPVACLLAMPTIWIQSTALLLASFPLYWERERFRTGARPLAATTARNATLVRAPEPEGNA